MKKKIIKKKITIEICVQFDNEYQETIHQHSLELVLETWKKFISTTNKTNHCSSLKSEYENYSPFTS